MMYEVVRNLYPKQEDIILETNCKQEAIDKAKDIASYPNENEIEVRQWVDDTNYNIIEYWRY